MTKDRSESPPSVLLRVLVADRGVSANDGLTALLSEFAGLSVFGCVQGLAKVLALVQAVRPDVVIVDLDSREPGELAELREIKRAAWSPTLIVLSHCDAPAARRVALAAGADHFLRKATDCARLGEILRELAQRRTGRYRGHAAGHGPRAVAVAATEGSQP